MRLDADRLRNLCPDGSRPLPARYDLDAAAQLLTPEHLARQQPTLRDEGWMADDELVVRFNTGTGLKSHPQCV